MSASSYFFKYDPKSKSRKNLHHTNNKEPNMIWISITKLYLDSDYSKCMTGD